MKNALIIFSIAILLLGCKKDIVQAPQLSNIRMDGHADEWQNQLVYHEKIDASFAVAHDDKNFYACFLTASPELQRQIMQSGLRLQFQTCDKNTKWGIKFPVGIRLQRPTGERQMSPAFDLRQNQETMREQMLKQAMSSLEILGKDNTISISTEAARNNGIDAQITLENGLFTYEIQIPLVTSPSAPYAINSLEQFEMKIEIDKTSMGGMPGREGRGGSMGRRPEGGMQGGMNGGAPAMGGGTPGGGPGGNMPDTAINDAVKLWMLIQLIH